jgi:hypothetical protein
MFAVMHFIKHILFTFIKHMDLDVHSSSDRQSLCKDIFLFLGCAISNINLLHAHRSQSCTLLVCAPYKLLVMVQDMDASFPPSGNALPMSAATAPPPTRSTPPPDLTATSANDHAAVHTPSLENRHEDNSNKERVVHEGDERERQNRELRAGLHPLQVHS